jgi:hypothetical protein
VHASLLKQLELARSVPVIASLVSFTAWAEPDARRRDRSGNIGASGSKSKKSYLNELRQGGFIRQTGGAPELILPVRAMEERPFGLPVVQQVGPRSAAAADDASSVTRPEGHFCRND